MAGICPQYRDTQYWCPVYSKDKCEKDADRNGHDCVLALGVASLAVVALASVKLGVSISSFPIEAQGLLERWMGYPTKDDSLGR